MNKCIKCGVNIVDQTDVCPLCHCVVEAGEEEQAAGRYPDIRLKGRKLELIGRIVLFLSIVLGVLSVIINLKYQTDIWWSAIVVGGLAYVLIIMFFMIENQHAGWDRVSCTDRPCIRFSAVVAELWRSGGAAYF